MNGPVGAPREPRPLQYVEFAPGPTVRDIALTYWGFSVREMPHAGFTHRVWPDGCATLVLVCAGGAVRDARVAGPSDRPREVPLFPGVCYWGVRFCPEAGPRWLGSTGAAMRDANLLASTLLGPRLETLQALVASVVLPEQLGNPDAPGALESVAAVFDRWIGEDATSHAIEPVVRAAVAVIVATDGAMPIAEVAEASGASMRSLQRRFREATGLTPKEFARVRRWRAAVKRMVAGEQTADLPGWADLAGVAGYADQSHLTREFARLTQFTPTALRQRLATIEHAALVD